MSERWEDQGTASAGQPVADGVSAGTLLRRAREASGLHVAALAVSLKVPVRKLEALEDDRWDLLTDLVFVRALASSVCRTLKIDPQPVLERLPQHVKPRLVHDGEGINTPFRAPSDGAAPTWFDQMSKPVFLAVFALLLGALVLILLPGREQDSSLTTMITTSPAIVAAAAPTIIPGPSVEPAALTVQAAVGGTAPTLPLTGKPTTAISPAAAATTTPAAPAVTTTAAVTASSNAPATAASGVVVFRTKGPSWVEVTDAKGVIAMRKELQAGEAAGASGVLPLQVTIGRVDYTEVQVRGKPFDLRPVSKDNVARFQVK